MPSIPISNKAHPPRAHRSVPKLAIIVFASTALVGFVGLVGWQFYVGTSTQAPVAAEPAATDRYSGSIIVSSPNRDSCRQYNLDNATGKMKDEGVFDCTSGANGQASGQQKRVNAIADGFRNR